MQNKIKVAVLGSTGYVGLELIRILTKHPHIDIVFLGSENFAGKRIIDFDIKLNNLNLPNLSLNKDLNFADCDILFLALPHGISQHYVKKFFNKIKIIDLSADFRFDNKFLYNSNYNIDHSCPELMNQFVYGLSEINKKSILNASNIATPGCYPTSVLLPLIPLLRKDLLDCNNIIIDSKSGYSGAGKNFDLSNIKNTEYFNFYNYNTNEHRHACEIKQELERHSKKKLNFSFNPHILPIYRGMMSTIYCDLSQGITPEDVVNELRGYYKKSPFVNILDQEDKADFFSIQNTNNCLIKLYNHHSKDKIIIVSLIDNLLKGAAGQAVQCLNIMLNLDETLSLEDLK